MAKRGWIGVFFGTLLATTACSSDDSNEGSSGDGDGDSATPDPIQPGSPVDIDDDGITDGTALDTDGDGVVDAVDTNGDGLPDVDFTPPPPTNEGTGGSGTGGTGSTCTMDVCGAECVDTMTDNANCGNCGVSCSDVEACQAGACVRVACEGTLELCGQECFDTTSDMNHCGQCDNACGLTFVCQGSGCTCTDGRTDCGGACTHTDVDRQNCGSCASDGGATCASDEACVSGTCQTISIPSETYCSDTNSWDSAWIAWEFEVLDIVNKRRAEGANCGSQGYFPPAGPLQMEASLRCAARMHSKDMVDRDFFSHDNPDGQGPGPRLDAAGYEGGGWGENIAAGHSSPEDVMAGWMSSDGHCSNIMNANYTLIGVGYYPERHWTQTFGR